MEIPNENSKTKLQVVKNGIDLTKFHMNNEKRMEYRSLLNIADGTIVIGHVGRFSFVKTRSFDRSFVSCQTAKYRCKINVDRYR